MDISDFNIEEHEQEPQSPRKLPDDLPRSLDDRRNPVYEEQTEIWDGWQGQSQFLTTPIPARPASFNLSLDDASYGDDDQAIQRLQDSDSRLVEMLASQARLKENNAASGEEQILSNETLSEQEKRNALQGMLTMAASNGEADRVRNMLSGSASSYIDVNMPDGEGTPPLIYASCFGHEEVAQILLEFKADVNAQDKNQWSPLMWAMTNRHKTIAKLLLDRGADPDVKSSTGRTAFDFLAPNSEMSEYLHESGYSIGNAGVTDDWYNPGLAQDRFEEEMAEKALKERMMMESAINLEVDLGNLGLDEQPESPDDYEEGQEFVWDKCLNDQMFVFQETELGRILDIVITKMTPQRSPSQKPVPANIIFLAARYAHYHAGPELLETLLLTAMSKINDAVERSQWDMTILAFWISNATLLLYYLKKDAGLVTATADFQVQLSELVNEIFILIIRDAERRMDKVLDAAILDHETIPGFEDITFQNEWKIFKRKKTVVPEPMEKRYRPPSPKRRAQIAPRNITSLLSSTLFVLDLYDIHSVITAQVLSQLLYWLGAELFNRIMENRKYLARTKAMQIRMNISTLEDWARQNNRQPEHFEKGSMISTGENTMEAARRHLAPVVQLLQWLQCFSSFGDDFDVLIGTTQQLPRLTPQQLLHAAKYYRAEVGEKGLSKTAMKYLLNLQKEKEERRLQERTLAEQQQLPSRPSRDKMVPSTPTKKTDANGKNSADPTGPSSPIKEPPSSPTSPLPFDGPAEEQDAPEHLLLDPSFMLPFVLPSSTDMLVTFGAGFGGTNRERERKYIPSVPSEFLAKLDASSNVGSQNGKDVYEQWG